MAIDVETANADWASICQIGIATFEGRTVVNEWESLINPRDRFSPKNISIHGITPEMVEAKPTLPEIAEGLRSRLEGQVVVCHTHFDRVATILAFESFGLRPPDCQWLDSARVARWTWSEFSKSGYSLRNLCDFLGYEFEHHNALADAKAAGHVLLSAIEHSGFDLSKWLEFLGPVSELAPPGRRSKWPEKTALDGNPKGPLSGEVLVFTGIFEIPTREAAELASELGCRVATNVTKKTTMLVVGYQDLSLLAGHKRSSKQRKAEELIARGQTIRILNESDFLELVGASENLDSGAPLPGSDW